jgi:hypothetical protein
MPFQIPGIDHVPEPLRVMMALGIGLFLVLLRFDAERFGAAEYDDADRWGVRPKLRRRIAWYVLGVIGIVVVLLLHPAPSSDLFLGLGERLGVVILGLLYGVAGSTIAVGIAFVRYREVRVPQVLSYPGAVLNAVATAFVDEAVFRGIVLGILVAIGTNINLAIVAQALLYALATRVGARGRSTWMLFGMLAMGFAGGFLTGITGGIGAAFVGHAITRVAIFFTTGHAGLMTARGTEPEEVEERRRTPDGWKVLDPDAKATERDR